jgi:hypothetical protein
VHHLIDLMERGLIDHIAMNGAGPIHDWEFAWFGQSTESVQKNVATGTFGICRDVTEQRARNQWFQALICASITISMDRSKEKSFARRNPRRLSGC